MARGGRAPAATEDARLQQDSVAVDEELPLDSSSYDDGHAVTDLLNCPGPRPGFALSSTRVDEEGGTTVSPLKTNLQLVSECDNHPYDSPSSPDGSVWYGLRYGGVLLGQIPEWVVDRMQEFEPTIWDVDVESRSLKLHAANCEALTRRLAIFLANMRDRDVFRLLRGWRDEEYPVYGPNRTLLVSMERSATPLFGVVTYGIHMTAFIRGGEAGDRERERDRGHVSKIWVPTRATGKQTYGGMMDNTVAGGLSTGEKPTDCLVREAREEASLPGKLVRAKAQACGTVTYMHIRDRRAGGETGLSQPECQYVYDLELEAEGDMAVIPTPNDDEVQGFHLMSVDEIKTALAEGRFKPNCALVMLDFFVRHGILTPENEPDYIEIVNRLHRKLPYPTA